MTAILAPSTAVAAGAAARGARRGRRTGAIVTGVVLGMIAIPASALTSPAVLPPLPLDTSPGLGNEPQAPVGHCTFPRLGAGEIRTVFSQWPPGNDTGALSTGDTVDPFDPCHILQVTAGNRVLRSDDGGRHFATVLTGADGASPPQAPVTRDPMVIGPVITPAPGEEYLIDTSGPYGVVHSADGGVHWEQRNHGLPLALNGPFTLRTLAFAPSNPLVGYVVAVANSTDTLLFQTADGGGAWSPVAVTAATTGVTATTITAVAVDPGDERHVFLGDRSSAAMWESPDAGASWTEHPLPSGTGASRDSLLVTHPLGHGPKSLRLYAKADNTGWMRSFDDGTTWVDLPAGTLGSDQALAADPANPDHMVLAAAADDGYNGDPLTLYTSADGFATLRIAEPLRVPWSGSAVHPFISGFSLLRLIADHAHDFFLEVVASPGWHQQGPMPVGDHLFAFQFTAVAPSPPPPVQQAAPWSAANMPNVPLPYAQTVRQCPLPSPFPSHGLVDLSASSQQTTAGSLTYDGHYLDYTQDTRSGTVAAGLIERVDPVTCRPTPALHPVLPGYGGTPAVIQNLTYDARYVFSSGHRGAILVLATWSADSPGSGRPYPIYAVDPLTGAVELALIAAPSSEPAAGQVYIFSYDVGADELWVTSDDGALAAVRMAMPAVHGGVATAVDTCMSRQYPFGPPLNSVATMLAVANGVMYAQLEDDTTVVRGDDRSCTPLDGFRHAKFSEPPDENEQIACDSISDGDGSAYAAAANAPTSLLWVRESVENSVSAYAIPDSFCPFPTTLALRASPTVLVGSAVSLCATLQRATADRIPIAGQTVSFRIDSVPAGAGRTDAQGQACTTTTAPAVAGAHVVHADFGGTHVSFMPSSAEGPLLTDALAVWAGVGPAAPLLVAGTPPPPLPQPLQQAQSVEQAQAEAQLQTQAQTQSQSVTQVQPGMMVQRQRRTQVAAEMLPARLNQPAFQASAVRPARRVPAVPAVLTAALLLGVGLVLRRPVPSLARIRRE